MDSSDNISVLHIDDEPTNVLLFEVNFRKLYEVISARSGDEGLEKLVNSSKVDVIFCDMKMPGMNGLEFARQAAMVRPGIPCFILTGYDISPEIYNAINEGWVMGYIQKPFEVDQIISAVNKVTRMTAD